MVNRITQLNDWLSSLYPAQSISLQTASADASARHYYRFQPDNSHDSLIIMDAPPPQEDCRPWLQIANLLRKAAVAVPEVFARDCEQGFVLMSDFGDTTYLRALNEHNAANLYADALGMLLSMQQHSRPGILPEYSRELLAAEIQLFTKWYLGHHRKMQLNEQQQAQLSKVFETIIRVNLSEARVFVHRDYHSRNIMYRHNANGPGILDFQDAVFGPISYDLVSLFKDAYICWEEEFVLDLLIRYWEMARRFSLPVPTDFSDFVHHFDWMGVQRHLKVLGIFARLYHRDGKAGYIDDMPRVFAYLYRSCQRYRELGALQRLLEQLEPDWISSGYTF